MTCVPSVDLIDTSVHYCDAECAMKDNFDLVECEVLFCGISGLRIGNDNAMKRVYAFIRAKRPDIVIVQLGENDIGSMCPLSLASKIEDMSVAFLERYTVKRVVICELFTRLRDRSIAPEAYSERRARANQYLSDLLADRDDVQFWNHRRTFQTKTPIFARDGVHVNSFGQQRFYRSLRLAIMQTVRALP